ncbi:unnamed protein product [Aphanomyces euteiches]|uniref:Uncharacterized protein n=1 Tax=Aphanomyces euteiches TaxID=100861 RepID=A0A6G0WRL3_9STRA|nr:hypothetical protein Ae201684_012381 [Aphanomyces euteiches]
MVSGGKAAIHAVFAVVGFVLLHFSYKYARKYYTQPAFLLPPFVCFCVIYENVILASVGIDKVYTSVKVMLVFQSCIIPAMLLICFEVAYLVHKNRSVNFCGISFDSGHRTHRNDFKSTFLRFAMWLVGVGLLTLKLLVFYQYFDDIEFTSGIYELNGSSTVGTILTIIPAFSLVVLAIYIGMRLWNYGSNYAYTVHSTCFNPWIWMMVGSCCLAAGYLLPDPLFAVSSNGGEICMLAAIIRMFREVHKDLQEGTEIANTLVGGGINDITVAASSASSPYTSPSEASTKYDLISTPRGNEETRLTDANTDAYLSVVIARTKERDVDEPKSKMQVLPWNASSHVETLLEKSVMPMETSAFFDFTDEPDDFISQVSNAPVPTKMDEIVPGSTATAVEDAKTMDFFSHVSNVTSMLQAEIEAVDEIPQVSNVSSAFPLIEQPSPPTVPIPIEAQEITHVSNVHLNHKQASDDESEIAQVSNVHQDTADTPPAELASSCESRGPDDELEAAQVPNVHQATVDTPLSETLDGSWILHDEPKQIQAPPEGVHEIAKEALDHIVALVATEVAEVEEQIPEQQVGLIESHDLKSINTEDIFSNDDFVDIAMTDDFMKDEEPKDSHEVATEEFDVVKEATTDAGDNFVDDNEVKK